MANRHYRNSALGDNTRLPYEHCAQTESESQSQRPGEYMVDLLGKKCDAPEQKQISLNERGNLFKDGYGWVSTDGCLVDKDSGLRNNRIYPSIHPENCKCRMCRKKKKAKK